jgi:hypothetical protein
MIVKEDIVIDDNSGKNSIISLWRREWIYSKGYFRC